MAGAFAPSTAARPITAAILRIRLIFSPQSTNSLKSVTPLTPEEAYKTTLAIISPRI